VIVSRAIKPSSLIAHLDPELRGINGEGHLDWSVVTAMPMTPSVGDQLADYQLRVNQDAPKRFVKLADYLPSITPHVRAALQRTGDSSALSHPPIEHGSPPDAAFPQSPALRLFQKGLNSYQRTRPGRLESARWLDPTARVTGYPSAVVR
jgi:hypothetical protein